METCWRDVPQCKLFYAESTPFQLSNDNTLSPDCVPIVGQQHPLPDSVTRPVRPCLSPTERSKPITGVYGHQTISRDTSLQPKATEWTGKVDLERQVWDDEPQGVDFEG